MAGEVSEHVIDYVIALPVEYAERLRETAGLAEFAGRLTVTVVADRGQFTPSIATSGGNTYFAARSLPEGKAAYKLFYSSQATWDAVHSHLHEAAGKTGQDTESGAA